jgi:hypothetical protein|uniref:Uncharacterized protein n=1 Tax=viral metagenome TaxID=1070528 RepID=A0A6C0LGI7_9ZZZZ
MIKTLIGNENVNVIEFYLVQKPFDNKDEIIDIYINDDLLNKIKNNFKKTKEYRCVTYSRNNYNYVYDLSNDSQYVYIRKLENTTIINKSNVKFYVLSFNEIKLPTHSFACSNDIDNKETSDIIEFKINNRITLIIKNNNCLINYKHNKDVDIDKVNSIISGIITKINLV